MASSSQSRVPRRGASPDGGVDDCSSHGFAAPGPARPRRFPPDGIPQLRRPTTSPPPSPSLSRVRRRGASPDGVLDDSSSHTFTAPGPARPRRCPSNGILIGSPSHGVTASGPARPHVPPMWSGGSRHRASVPGGGQRNRSGEWWHRGLRAPVQFGEYLVPDTEEGFSSDFTIVPTSDDEGNAHRIDSALMDDDVDFVQDSQIGDEVVGIDGRAIVDSEPIDGDEPMPVVLPRPGRYRFPPLPSLVEILGRAGGALHGQATIGGDASLDHVDAHDSEEPAVPFPPLPSLVDTLRNIVQEFGRLDHKILSLCGSTNSFSSRRDIWRNPEPLPHVEEGDEEYSAACGYSQPEYDLDDDLDDEFLDAPLIRFDSMFKSRRLDPIPGAAAPSSAPSSAPPSPSTGSSSATAARPLSGACTGESLRSGRPPPASHGPPSPPGGDVSSGGWLRSNAMTSLE